MRTRTLGQGPRQVLWIGGIHGNEREGRVATDELAAAFLAHPEAPERVTLTLVEDANPDGSASNRRGNARGVDLNRNFPATNYRARAARGTEALSQPETRALHDLIEALDPDLVLVAHSWPDACFINHDGPARELAERFAETSGWPVRESSELHATPGSLGSWVGLTLGRPILTIEYRRGTDPRAAWEETRAAILEAVLGD
jgi:protein MpaA